MDALKENKISMYFKVRTFFAAHLAALAALITQLTATAGLFNTKLDELGDLDQEATENITGYTVQKDVYRSDMRSKALGVAGGLRAYALSADNNPLANKAHLTKSSLDLMRDTEILYACERLYKFATDNAAAIIPFGVTAAMLTAFNNAITDFKEFIQTPADQRGESSAAGKGVDAKMDEIDAVLLQIDGMMLTQAETQPVLYDQYRLDRLIDDNTGGSGTPPDVTMTLPPEAFTLVLTLPYLAGRAFKAKNLGDAAINWGLSTEAGSFSNPSHELEAGAISTMLSSTLAPNGDNLVFENPSASPVDIEVTVIE